MKNISVIICLLWLPFGILAQQTAVFSSIQLEDPIDACKEKLEGISATVQVKSPSRVTFPLAEKQEVHLVCSELKTEYGTLQKAVFTFGDGKLKYVEARGNTMEVFMEHRKDTASYYMDYAVYPKAGLFVNPREDMAWILTPEAMHVNLFTWSNPYLDKGAEILETGQKTEIPGFLKMGAVYEALKPDLESNSSFTVMEELDGSDPNAQFQVNCFGVEYLGFPRKVEARFGNNTLNVVWILTGKAEEDRVRQALVAQFGAPVYVNDDWEIYNNWQVGLRKDKPEVLLMEQEIGLQYKKSYFGQ